MKRSLLRVLRWLGIAYAVYLALSLLVVFPALNILTPGLVKDATNRELQSEIILFNPFTLALEVRKARLLEADGHQPLGLKQIKVDLSLSSLWETGIVLDAFVVQELDLHVLRYANGDFHFTDLIESGKDSAPKEPTPVPAITIRRIAFDARSIRYTDRTRPGPYSTELRDFALRKNNLTTVPNRKGDGVLELTGDGGGALRWSGDTDLAGGRSSGELTLTNIDLRPAWRYNAEQLGFVVASARLDAVLDYTALWNGEPDFTLRGSTVRLHAVDIQPAERLNIAHTDIKLESLDLAGIDLDLASQRLELATIAIDGFELNGVFENEQVSLLPLFAPPQSDAVVDEAPAADDSDSVDADPAAGWTLLVKQLNMDNSMTAWRTSLLTPEVLAVSPLRFSASDIRWPAEALSPFNLQLAVNEVAATELSGALHLGTGAGDARLTLDGLPIPWINPLLNTAARTDISRGSVSLETTVSLEDFAPTEIAAGLIVSDFATVLHETSQEAFSLERLSVIDAQISMSEQAVRVAELQLQRPIGSLHILEDGRMNVNGVVRGAATDEDDSEQLADSSAAEAAGAPNAKTAASEPTWRVALDKLTLREGRLDFADASLPLPFETLIDSIEADATDIDTAAEKPLELLFTGSVDGYAPVRIEGRGRPLAEDRDGELMLDFQGMDIATMSPYAGTYAGYSIDSGTLSVNLRYGLNGQQVDGDNRVVISQMELGEPVESELAIDVPLKLGLALLTDSAGVIDLSVPVSGDVSDPSFSLGPIIGMAIKNIIIKAVTAPFSLLAGLVGSEDDLENIQFAAGEENLGPEAISALDALAKALQQRPKLQLRIVGSSDPLADGEALRSAILRQSLLDSGLSQAAIDARDAAFVEVVAARFSAIAAGADASAAKGATSSDEGETEPPSVEEQWQRLIADVELPASALRSLGTQRAAAAKRELVNTGEIDAARIAISYDETLALAGSKMVVDS